MKRIFIELKLKNIGNKIISFNQNHKISSFIYSLLKTEYPELHDSKIKNKFTFSHLMSNDIKIIKGVGIKLLSESVVLIVSTSDEKMVDCFLNAIDYSETYRIEDVYFTIKKVKLDSDKIDSHTIHFRTITPICLTKSRVIEGKLSGQRFLSPNDEDYLEYLKKNIQEKIGVSENMEIYILPETVKSKSVELIKNNQTVKAYNYDFMIKLDNPTLLNKCYFDGFGIKNSQGFGMVQIINK